MAGDEILFRTGHPLLLRVLIGAGGLCALVLPAWQLRPWSMPLPISLFFWIIVIGAASVGAAFLAGAVLARPGEVRARPGGLELTELSWRGARTTRIDAGALGDPEVKRFESDSGPDKFYVQIPRAAGHALSSGLFDSRAGAEALADRLRAMLRP